MHCCSLNLHVLDILFTLHDGAQVSLKKDLASEHRALLVMISMKLESPNLVFVQIVLSHSSTTCTSQFHTRTVINVAELFHKN